MLGIIFALLALVCWGFGDFLIQKNTRKIGDVRSLFWIGFVGGIILLPFIIKELPLVFKDYKSILLLSGSGILISIASLFDFESFKRGKISIVEPVLSLELLVVVALSIFIWEEQINTTQFMLALAAFFGIILVVTTNHAHLHYHKRIFEKGVGFAIIGFILMGSASFLIGVSSQETSPIMSIWFTDIIIVLFCLISMIISKEIKDINTDVNQQKINILKMSLIDNAAWVSFAFAVNFIPISIATTVSEGYIALAALLGAIVNKEKLRRHQIIGIFIVLASVLTLSYLTEK